MSEIEIKSLDSSYIDECLDLVWQVFSEFETPVFPPEGSFEYKRIIEETKNKVSNAKKLDINFPLYIIQKEIIIYLKCIK